MTLILASNSASRRAMLEAAGVSVEPVGADVDERALEAEMSEASPEEIAQALAAAKASAVSVESPGALVLGGDSLVVVDGRRFDKPRNREEAAEHLRFFSGKVMHLHSAAALARDGRIVWLGTDAAALHVRELSDEFIEGYLAAEWPAVGHTVGVFRIEAMGVQLFDRIFGDHFTILGMPLLQVLDALREEGELAS
ncbi:MAG: septum formation protein Maf [Citromicrobium sp.]|nr:septum formation protein Maf [Citromicrobium sp.]MAO95251.1 septum formation protein Maf [Citromicrobium sp.]MAS85033.1 septum formation protein Maf [Erythrobacteraceae bacterium]MBD76057.1 septum formation protein Maf [Citromicrobium sp.]MBT45656.1 septum formation protein Maf [Citromicrobium sp.]